MVRRPPLVDEGDHRVKLEDDLGGQRGPLPDVLGVSQDPANRVLRVGPELLVEVVVVIDSDVGARRNGQETIG